MIILGSDHAGLKLKEQIKKCLLDENVEMVDVGSFSFDENDDFSKFAKLIEVAFLDNKDAKIVAVCGSGVGMNIAMNKIKGVRCVLGHTKKEVQLARMHNDVNAISFSGKNTSLFSAKRMIYAFLNTNHLGGKYKKRMDEIEIK